MPPPVLRWRRRGELGSNSGKLGLFTPFRSLPKRLSDSNNRPFDPNCPLYDPNKRHFDLYGPLYDPNNRQLDPNSRQFDPNKASPGSKN